MCRNLKIRPQTPNRVFAPGPHSALDPTRGLPSPDPLATAQQMKIPGAITRYTVRICVSCELCNNTLCSKKSDAKTEITITTSNLIRIKHPLSNFNYHLSGANVANFNKIIHRTVSEQQLFKKWNSKTEVSIQPQKSVQC